jgi:hypothetical protein
LDMERDDREEGVKDDSGFWPWGHWASLTEKTGAKKDWRQQVEVQEPYFRCAEF